MEVNSVQQNRRGTPNCASCKNHGLPVPLQWSHKTYCPYRNCTCQKCTKTAKRRQKSLKAQAEKRWTHHLGQPVVQIPLYPRCSHQRIQITQKGKKHLPKYCSFLDNENQIYQRLALAVFSFKCFFLYSKRPYQLISRLWNIQNYYYWEIETCAFFNLAGFDRFTLNVTWTKLF